MNTIKYNEILKTYQRIDLYRAKYRHSDFTPYAWCFHGDKQQEWTGQCKGGFLRFSGQTTYNDTASIDASTYKYLSFRFTTPGYMPKLLRYKLAVGYTIDGAGHVLEIVLPYSGQLTTVFYDMSNDPAWTGTVTGVNFSLSSESSADVWIPVTTEVCCEYIKFDKENVFANVLDNNTVTIVDFNEMRGDIETFAKQTIDWESPGTSPNRVRQFIDTIKKSDIDQVNQKISTLSPYNGCATCDNYQCSCDSTDYGHIPCQACDGCNEYKGCATCDQTCHEQARSCACDTTCYGQATGCSCNSTCYGYSSCICDFSCNTCNTAYLLCTVCNASAHRPQWVCEPCYSTCFSHTCLYEHTDHITYCDYCYVGCDVAGEQEGCRTYGTGPNGGCKCNSTCYIYESSNVGTWNCAASCDVQRCGCNTGDDFFSYYACDTCDHKCYVQEKGCSTCFIGFGKNNSCSSCNQTCYGQPTGCTCNSTCHTQARSCSCDRKCYSYQACVTCDGCNTYLPCSCDSTCHEESCEQCHKTGYSSVPI